MLLIPGNETRKYELIAFCLNINALGLNLKAENKRHYIVTGALNKVPLVTGTNNRKHILYLRSSLTSFEFKLACKIEVREGGEKKGTISMAALFWIDRNRRYFIATASSKNHAQP